MVQAGEHRHEPAAALHGPADPPRRRGPRGNRRHNGRRAPPLLLCYTLFPLLRLFTLCCTRKRSVAEGERAQQRERGVVDGSAWPTADPRDRWAGVPRRHRWHHAEGLTRNGAGGVPGTVLRWGHVQICCKGAPGRDRPREKAWNINVSSRASARSGPLQQIWTTGAARAPRRGRRPVGRQP